jgi:heat-inducible transcriptional repressor
VQYVELASLGGPRGVFLLVDDYGRAVTQVIPLPAGADGEGLSRLNRFLNEELRGVAIDEVPSRLERRLETFADEQRSLAEQAAAVVKLLPLQGREGQLFLEGATQLFEQPEFKNVDKAREVFGLLEERDRVVELLRCGTVTPSPGETRVLIGTEKAAGLEDVSVVSAPYSIGDRPAGMIGVLGPRRMPYNRLTGIVEYTAAKMSALLTRLAQ